MKILFIIVITALVLLSPSIVKAEWWSDDFNDGTMGSQWHLYTDGQSGATFTESPVNASGVLNFTTPASEDGWSDYKIVAPLDLTQDFKFKAQFVNTTSPSGNNVSGLDFGLIRPDYNSTTLFAYGSLWNRAGNISAFDLNIETSDNSTNWHSSVMNRGTDSGWIGLQYVADGGILRVGMYSVDPETFGALPILSAEYGTFAKDFGTAPMYFTLTGWSEGSEVTTGQMNFDNFSGVGAVAPEPISSALFLLGGAVLAIKRSRKKSV